MPSDLGCYAFAAVLFILLLGLLLCRLWRCGDTTPSVRKPPRPKREPTPFAGLTRKPECEACEQQIRSPPQSPSAPPPRLILTRGRRRQVDTAGHFCPRDACSYYGWVGFGNLRANGHPTGRRWRQLFCLGCRGDFLETHGTPLHAKQVELDKLVWALAALAEGLGLRAVARVFEVDPNTVLGWLSEAAEHLEAFSHCFLRDVNVARVQMDELFALLSAVKGGEITEAQAIQRLSRSPHWVWVAMDPMSKLILTTDVGDRTLAMAQRLVHQLTHVLAPDWTPLSLTDGFRDYLIALVTHDGQWLHPEAPPGQRSPAYGTLDATARAALCTGRQVLSASTPGQGRTPCRVWHARGHRANTGHARLEDQYGVCGALKPRLSPTYRRHWAAGPHAVQTRSGTAPPADSIPDVSQFRLASRELALATASGDPRDSVSQAVAAADARDGRRPDQSGVECERSADVSCAPVAAGPSRLRR
jgi:hypothetical protein